MYHRVTRLVRDPYLLAVEPDLFAEQIRTVKRFADIVPLSAVTERSADRRIAITFDDGYVDIASDAEPILEAMAAPATVFVTAGMVGVDREFWWDELEHVLLDEVEGSGYLDVEVDGCRLWVDVRTAAGRERARRALHPRLRLLRPREIDDVLREVKSQLGYRDGTRSSHRVLRLDELRELAGRGVIEVGSHTVSHPLLARLPLDEQWDEINRSRQLLEAMIDRPVRTFAYPFGTRDSADERTFDLVREAGYELAVLAYKEPDRRNDRFQLPRHYVGDWDPAELEARLCSWFGG